jgi:hypothetical protein
MYKFVASVEIAPMLERRDARGVSDGRSSRAKPINLSPVCTENLIRVDGVVESLKLAE